METARLRRSLGLFDAVVIGMGAMLGAGIFGALEPAAERARHQLLLALVLAALVAYANATSSARLAARYPEAGGTYAYARELLGPGWSLAAGWAFVVGKLAALSAMASIAAAYLVSGSARRPVAAAIALAATALVASGVRRTARATAVLVALVLAALGVVVWSAYSPVPRPPDTLVAFAPTPITVLQGAGILFFAFAGYARIATLGEEVRDPARTIPRAIAVAFAAVLAIYWMVAAAVLDRIGVNGLILSPTGAPLEQVVQETRPHLAWVASVGALVAIGGVLLSLLAGVSRTVFAMARDGRLPSALARVAERTGSPLRAELAVGATVAVLAGIGGVGRAIAVSSFGVLLYYAVTNLAALRVGAAWGRAVAAFGLGGCLTLAVVLPPVVLR